jgi:hypothetical protein
MGSYFYRSQPRKKPEYPEKTLCRWWTIVALTTLPPPKPPMQTSFLNWRLNISDQPTQTRIVYWILVTLEKHKRLLLSTIYTAHPPPPPPPPPPNQYFNSASKFTFPPYRNALKSSPPTLYVVFQISRQLEFKLVDWVRWLQTENLI